MQEDKKSCAVCKTAAEQKCSACQAVYYCSREHQKSDWKIHAKNCQPCKLAVDAKIGRHYIATRDIKVGEIVLRDNAPLITGVLSDKPACLSCYDDLTSGNAKPCGKCGWPLCNRCTKHGGECDFTIKYRKTKVTITNYDKPHNIYKAIIVIRALSLRESDPEAYRKILKLEDHCGKFAKKQNILDSPNEMARLVKSFFNYEEVELAEIARIYAIVQINGIMVKFNEPHHGAVYDKSSKVEHNCRANCSKSYTIDGGIFLWAAVPISKGEHISISYVDCTFGTMKRRLYLAQSKFFECDCKRCKDPTEFGTMFSVFTCMKDDCTGFMIPPTFLAPDDNVPNFVCNKCSKTVPWIVIEKMEERLDEKLHKLEDDAQAMKQFIDSQSKIVHKNHYSHFNTDLELARNTDPNSLSALSDKSLDEVIERCKRLINLFETLQPAANGSRGVLTFMLIQANAIVQQRRKLNFHEISAYANNMKHSLKKVYQLLRYESPNCRAEFGVAMAALAELNKMEQYKPVHAL